ncbi:alpha/beta fold hydrolase [Methylomonas sp. LL1]|uniref:alpha/beta fold hydrolase n=1 Tax=Methylomonas sp. LL1 TaxID=2785785 RepID=UPI0018C3FDA5|nr:alpha/beta fold hydrolase [Methylomonas sp. LL1]QPK61569.1 alpha/beta fold hydrolase [Methylomonas sp. LL1]
MKPVDLVFESFGDAQACPLIILHGFLASSRNWRTVANRLAEKHHVYVLDMRNHGASPHAEHMDYPVMASDIAWFMDNLGLQKAHLLGHSMGGKIAMWFALHYPDRVEKLMVADIAPVNYKHGFDAIIHALRQVPLDQLTNRKHAEQYLAEAIPDMRFRQFLLQNLLLKDGRYFWRINLDIIRQTAHHIVGFPEPIQPTYPKPALFIAGQHSAYIQPETVFRTFPRAEIVEIADTGHWLYVEAPEAFCRAINEWIHSG